MAADAAATELLTHHVLNSRDERDNSKIRLSGAGSCSRQLGFKVMGVPEEPTPLATLVTFEIGHSYHAMVQKWLVDMEWVDPAYLEYSMVDERRRIKGTCDAITERLDKEGHPTPSGTRRVVEIKSISNMPRELNGRACGGAFDGLEKPRDHHIDQATAYSYLWNERFPEDPVTHVMFIYVAKDGGTEMATPLKVFTQALSRVRWERLEAKFGRIWEHLDKGELPMKDHDPFSVFSPCRFCGYKAACLAADS